MEDLLYQFLTVYDKLPTIIKNIIGNIYSKIPNQLRYGYFYNQYLQRIRLFFNNPQEVDKLQFRLLMNSVNNAIINIDFYKDFSPINSFEEFKKLPIVSKKDYVINSSIFYNHKQKRKLLAANTGGSSGTPMKFYLEKNVTRSKEHAQYNWLWGLYGFKTGAKILMLRGKPLNNNRLYEYQSIKNCLNVSCYELAKTNIEIVIKEIKRFRPEYVHAYPSAISILLSILREKHMDNSAFASIKALFLGSEFLAKSQKDEIEKFFNASVCTFYGHSECAVLASTLPHSDLFACMPFYGFIELLDDDNMPVIEIGKSGRIVATSFDNTVMPFIRYDTGDKATLGPNLEWNGIRFMTLSSIDGRVQDVILLSNGEKITLTSFIFGQHFPEFSFIREMQLEQYKRGELLIRIVPTRLMTENEKNSICSKLQQSVNNHIVISIECVEHIEKTHRGKHRFLIQHENVE